MHMQNTLFRKQYAHGFTLVELIVVIVILGILTLASGTAYIATLRTSRDGRRKIDMENIKQALEAYHSDNSTYPYTADGAVPLSSLLDPPSGKKYITMPKDPKSKQDYYYIEAGCELINGTNVCNSYTLGVILENTPNNIPESCTNVKLCPNPNTGVLESCNYCLDPYGPFPTPTPIQGGGPGFG